MNRFLLLIMLVALVYSCSSRLFEQVQGHWVVDKVVWKNQEYPNYSFLANMISFSTEGLCRVPIQNRRQAKQGKWSVVDTDKNLISIDIANEMFTGVYNVTVYPTHDTIPEKMILQSESTIIYCSLILP